MPTQSRSIHLNHLKPGHGHGHGREPSPPLNKEFLESRDFTSLEHPPEPKRTPDPFAQKDEGSKNKTIQETLASVSHRLQSLHPSSDTEHKHLYQQKSVLSNVVQPESPEPSDDIKFRPVFQGPSKENEEQETGELNPDDPLSRPAPIRRNSSLYEDFKKHYYHNTHMFDSRK